MNRYALIVGINSYQSKQIPDLAFAVSDANSISESLLSAGICQISKENCSLLLEHQATRAAIIDSLDQLHKKLRNDDIFLFYFAGHGYSERSDNGDPDDKLIKYIVPSDADPKNIDSTAIDFGFLAERLHRIRAAQQIMLFDCCHSGAAGGRTFQRGRATVYKNVGREYLAKLTGAAAGKIVMTACTGGEVAQEDAELGHGLFTYHILEGLSGAADFKNDNFIDVEELWMYVQQKMLANEPIAQNATRTGWHEGPPIYVRELPSKPFQPLPGEPLDEKIVTRFSKHRLQRVVIADAGSSLGATAASYLERTLKSNSKIAVSCGRTIVDALTRMSRSNLTHVEIFPLNGMPGAEIRVTDSTVLALLLWSKFDPEQASAYVVPIGVPEGAFEKIKGELGELAKQILAEAKNADVFLLGIGTPARHNRNVRALLERANLSEEEIKLMGAVGEINFHLYNKDGQFLTLDDRLSESDRKRLDVYSSRFFSLSVRDLTEITTRPGVELIAVAGGKNKFEAIAGALRGGFIRTLITDLETAEWLTLH